MKIHGTGKYSDLLKNVYWRELCIQPCFGDEKRFAKIIAWVWESWHAIKTYHS